MENQHLSVRKIINYINNSIEQGGFWLPNIQRHFVWSTDQIIKLFDSIMREYPVGTLMIWKTNEKIRCRRFISNYKENMSITNTYETPNDNQKMLVLDGQQRLQSMYIALKGSYEGEELYIDVLHDVDRDEDIKYKFKFLKDNVNEKSFIKLKDIIFSNKKPTVISREVIKKIKSDGIEISEDDEDKITEVIEQIVYIFCTQDVICYQVLDSVDNKEIYNENDIVEIFIRANSGGTILEKSDLLFALLTVYMDDIEERLEELLEEINAVGYKFNRDFILKTCLTLIGAGAKYEVDKFRKDENIQKINDNWDEICNAIKDVKDFIYGRTYLRCDKTLGAYNPLIPIIYLRYKYKAKYYEAIDNGLSSWLIKTILLGIYSGSADSLIDLTVKDIEEKGEMDFESLKTIFRNRNKSVDMTEDNILSAGYNTESSRRKLYLLFSLWYGQFNFTPSFKDNSPNIDHIFQQSLLKSIRIMGDKGRPVQKYKSNDINQLANCMLLTASENQGGGKSNISPQEWFKDKSKDYLKMHLIPDNTELWKVENFELFIEERKQLIKNKFSEIFKEW